MKAVLLFGLAVPMTTGIRVSVLDYLNAIRHHSDVTINLQQLAHNVVHAAQGAEEAERNDAIANLALKLRNRNLQAPPPRSKNPVDRHYYNLRQELRRLFRR